MPATDSPAGPFGYGMYNYRTGKYESSDLDLTTLPAARLKDFLPQNPSAHVLLDVRIALGSAPLDALRDVLIACSSRGGAAMKVTEQERRRVAMPEPSPHHFASTAVLLNHGPWDGCPLPHGGRFTDREQQYHGWYQHVMREADRKSGAQGFAHVVRPRP